ncbi:MAG: hypothetical protein V4486_01275 [Patescibacteria group bacterium]
MLNTLKRQERVNREWVMALRGVSPAQEAEVLKVCKRCYAFGYHGSWHLKRPDYLQGYDKNEKVSVRLTQCPDCEEIVMNNYLRVIGLMH